MSAEYFDRCEVCEKTIYQTPDKTLISHEQFFLCTACDAAADEILVGTPYSSELIADHREAIEGAQEAKG